jgi:putative photosynthetic complex assembly protein 2
MLCTVLVWWWSTGVILFLVRRKSSTHARSFAAATVFCAVALYGLWVTRNELTVLAAYAAFLCSLLVWGWLEMAFLMGFATGPRRSRCPHDATELRRLGAALGAILNHELSLLAAGSMVAAITWSGANQVGAATFLVLWIMRLSAKLNLFLGVRNCGEDFLPDKVRYLETYFRRRPMNLLFPVSIVAASIVAGIGWSMLGGEASDSFAGVGLNLVCSLLSLAILEHLLMVVPLPTQSLWRWALQPSDTPARPVPGAGAPERRATATASRPV